MLTIYSLQIEVEEDKGLFKRSVDLFEENIKIKFLLSDIRDDKKDLQQQLVSFDILYFTNYWKCARFK